MFLFSESDLCNARFICSKKILLQFTSALNLFFRFEDLFSDFLFLIQKIPVFFFSFQKLFNGFCIGQLKDSVFILLHFFLSSDQLQSLFVSRHLIDDSFGTDHFIGIHLKLCAYASDGVFYAVHLTQMMRDAFFLQRSAKKKDHERTSTDSCCSPEIVSDGLHHESSKQYG